MVSKNVSPSSRCLILQNKIFFYCLQKIKNTRTKFVNEIKMQVFFFLFFNCSIGMLLTILVFKVSSFFIFFSFFLRLSHLIL